MLRELFTPPDEAIQIIKDRRCDLSLVNRVSEFLNHDVLDEFSGSSPVFYLPRHLATPSFETLYAIEFAKSFEVDLVVGEDSRGTFVTNNELKLPLGKLPIEKGKDKNSNSIIENLTVIDISVSQGKPMSEIITHYGMNLPEFHSHLMRPLVGKGVATVDEADWIDRNSREDILGQYKKSLALTCVNTIMLEWYTPNERQFSTEVFEPAFNFVCQKIGVRPLVVELLPVERDAERNWNSYPFEVHEVISQLVTANKPTHRPEQPS